MTLRLASLCLGKLNGGIRKSRIDVLHRSPPQPLWLRDASFRSSLGGPVWGCLRVAFCLTGTASPFGRPLGLECSLKSRRVLDCRGLAGKRG